MTNETCGCLDNDEKIILLKCIESNKKKILVDINDQINIKDVDTMRDDLKKLDKTLDRVVHMPLC